MRWIDRESRKSQKDGQEDQGRVKFKVPWSSWPSFLFIPALPSFWFIPAIIICTIALTITWCTQRDHQGATLLVFLVIIITVYRLRKTACGYFSALLAAGWQEGPVSGSSAHHPFIIDYIDFTTQHKCVLLPPCLAWCLTCPIWLQLAHCENVDTGLLALGAFCSVGLLQHILRVSPPRLWAQHACAHVVAKLIMPISLCVLSDILVGADTEYCNLFMQLVLSLRWGVVHSSAHPFPRCMIAEDRVLKLSVTCLLLCTAAVTVRITVFHIGLRAIEDTFLHSRLGVRIDLTIYFKAINISNNLRRAI